jgi:TRAP-type C4-dicarboxylate transport system permease small subunit
MEMVSDMGTIISAMISGDVWAIRQALRADAAYALGAITVTVAGYGMMMLYRAVPVIERQLERTVMVGSYLAIAYIIFSGVIERFVFNDQEPWSTTIPPFLFMIMAWFGASYNVRLRTHLSFNEFRMNMPRVAQYICLWLDAVLWFVFAVIVFVTTARQTALVADNFAIVMGTDNVMQWWFLTAAPIAFVLLVTRVFQNLSDDIRAWRNNEPLIKQAVIGGDT